jgi:sterol desaturase/sphingolipid hydroxylase (fatty acid hydroxylase superfamily)
MQYLKKLIQYGVEDFIVNSLIYLAIAFPFFAVFWWVWKQRFQHLRIQAKQRNTPTLLKYEIKHSTITLLIFAVIDVMLYVAQTAGITQLYTSISEYGWFYFFFSILLMIVLHDAWFYFTHRFMHHPQLFKHFHSVHHKSTDPSPFAAFSFHPLEALVEAGVYVIFSFLFPVNIWALYVWQITQMTLNVIGHLGYEIYPKGLNTHWLFKWKTPSTHHNMHHSHFSGNYGLYFTWWDKIFNTEFKDYNKVYEKIHSRISEHKGKLTILIFIFSSHLIQAQTFHLNTGVGFGKPYIIESIEENKNMSIGSAPFFTLGIKYMTKPNNKWGALFSIQHFEARSKGITKISKAQVDGFISNTTFLVIAEKEKPFKRNKNWNSIIAYGIGLSTESYLYEAESIPRKNTYPSAVTYAGFSRKLNDKLGIRMISSLLITDVIKGVHYLSGNWTGQSANEDISLNIFVGITYKIQND